MQNQSVFENLFVKLSVIPPSKFTSELLQTSIAQFLPHKSIRVMTNAIKDIFMTNEPRLLVLLGHLYLDYALEKVLIYQGVQLNRQQMESFFRKVESLKKLNLFHPEVINGLEVINKLRNQFAHNIFFNLTDWDPNTMPYVVKHKLKPPKAKHFRMVFILLILKFSFLTLLETLSWHSKHSAFGYLPNTPTSRKAKWLDE